jgi:HAD superfamily hydrolase (TIGR01509 family)
MLRHILFDNDGTIVDSEIIAVRVMLRHLRQFGLEMSEKEYSARFPGLLERDILAILRRDFGLTLPDSFLQDQRTEHINLFNKELRAIPGMPAIFRGIRTPKSMVSNGSVGHVVRSLKKVRLHSALDGQIFSAEQVQRPKPYPDVYLLALETLRLEPHEVLAIEDSPTGIESAKLAGLNVVGFLGAAHVFEGHREQLLEKGADHIAANAKELKVIFKKYGVL